MRHAPVKVDYESLLRNGFARLESLLPKNLLDEFERVVSHLGETGLRRKGLKPSDGEALSDLLKIGGEYRKRLFLNLKNLRIVHQMGMMVSDRLEASGFLEWAKLDVPVAYPTLRADPPYESKYLLPFHQDYATQCRRAWRVWVPLRAANREAGTMLVLPGTHSLGFVEHDTSDPARPVVPESIVAEHESTLIDLSAGDGIIFNPLLIHASVPATMNRMKYVLLVQIQDLSTLADEDDLDDPLPARLAMTKRRDEIRN